MAEKRVIKDDFKKVNLKYPKLKLVWEEETMQCIGEVDVFDKENVYWDSFLVKITIPIKSYPYFFPNLFISDDRIPKEDDRHVNFDSSCCVEVEQKQILRAKKGITILQFLDEYVIPYFADQLYYEKENDWANGDYQHGIDGKIQYYSELTGVENLEEILYILRNLERINTIEMYQPCFCKSGKKLKYCHKTALKKLLQLPKPQIDIDIQGIEKKNE